jgi:two-component system chemotaxis sensor kinase CheA
MVGELVITQSMLGELDSEGPLDARRLARIREGLGQLARNTRSLQDSVMRLRSMSVGTVFNRFPRLVRELGERLGKEIALEITGQDTELDKGGARAAEPTRWCTWSATRSITASRPTTDRVAAGKAAAGTIRLARRPPRRRRRDRDQPTTAAASTLARIVATGGPTRPDQRRRRAR